MAWASALPLSFHYTLTSDELSHKILCETLCTHLVPQTLLSRYARKRRERIHAPQRFRHNGGAKVRQTEKTRVGKYARVEGHWLYLSRQTDKGELGRGDCSLVRRNGRSAFLVAEYHIGDSAEQHERDNNEHDGGLVRGHTSVANK